MAVVSFFSILEVPQGFWGTREYGQIQLGNRKTKSKYSRKQGNMKQLYRDHENITL